MKMTTEVKHKYYEFSEKDNDYYALIAANSKDEAISDYYEDVVGVDYDYEVICKELPASTAWTKLIDAGLSEESALEELLEMFDNSGLLLISEDLY